jgi:hypothetical protein
MKRRVGVIFLVVALTASLGLVSIGVLAVDGGPAGVWHLDEGIGTTASDSSGNANHGTLYDGDHGNGDGNTPPQWVDGKVGKALLFDGVDDYVEVGDDVSLNPSEITIEAWVNPSSWPANNAVALVTKRTATADGYFLFYYEGNTQTIIFDWGGSSGTNRWNTGYVPPLNTWTHLAVTRNSAGRALYVDGELYSSTQYAGAPASTGAPLRIGCDTIGYKGLYPFHGMIDEVRIWAEALSASQLGDVSPPVVTIAAPTNGDCYRSENVPAGAYGVSDANPYTVVESGYSTAEGLHTYTVTATDVLGYVGSASVTYTVDNTPPVVTITSPAADAYQVGDVPAGTFDVSDADSYTVAESGYSIEEGLHTYTVTATDALGYVGSASVTYVVYNPSAGFVTGGGWIYSEAGADVLHPDAEGKANFGFVSKYKKGADVPDGQTEFHFKAGDLNFHSTSYDWLLVAGPNAKFKGIGTINGQGNFGFMLTATDGQLNGGDGVDKFRIKIWDIDNGGAVVYDNKMGQPDDSNEGTELGGGSVIIHKGQK